MQFDIMSIPVHIIKVDWKSPSKTEVSLRRFRCPMSNDMIVMDGSDVRCMLNLVSLCS